MLRRLRVPSGYASFARCFSAPNAQAVKDLRALTGAPIGKCREALLAADSVEGAVRWLRERRMAQAQKLASREAREGLVAVAVTPTCAVAAELLCETDFVGRTTQFVELTDAVARAAARVVEGGENGALDPELMPKLDLTPS